MNTRKTMLSRTNKWLSILALMALLVGACVPTPEAQPTASELPVVLPPTEPPPPTATPYPLPPPRLLSRQPAPGEAQPLEAPIELTFDQPMDRSSVEEAFSISPRTGGTFTWLDDRTVRFLPGSPMERGERYEVAVEESAASAQAKPLTEPVHFEFSTIGYLAVSQVLPAPGSEEQDPNTTITVVFDRPVVPLTSLKQQAELPDPLTLTPQVVGEGEWLNTSIYVFRPEGGLLPATRYKARVAADLPDTGGGVLVEDYVWEFTTIRPAVLEVQPWDGYQYAGPTDVISVTFNQPMDRTSAQASFSLEGDGQRIAGAFRWSGGRRPNLPETMVFVPDRPLPRDTRFSARLRAGAGARGGQVGTEADVTWAFSTVKQPAVLRTYPADGDRGVEVGIGTTFQFASPMNRKSFLDHLVISPQATEVYTYWAEYDTEVRVEWKQGPVQAYSVSLTEGAADKHGASLEQTTQVRFTTGDLSPYATLYTGGRLGYFSAYTDTLVYVAHRNVTRVELSLFRLDVPTFMNLNTDWSALDRYVPSEKDRERQWTVELQVPRNKAGLQAVELNGEDGPRLLPGAYLLELSAPELKALSRSSYQPQRFLFVKSRINLTLKQTRTEALVWATDLKTGQPAPGVPVALYAPSRGGRQLVAPGVTDPQGLFQVQDLPEGDLWDTFFAVADVPGNPQFAIAYNGWDEGISPWSFDVESEFWASDFQSYLYTDRPIYRPGQTVYFKGIVRADDDARYSLPSEIETLEVLVNDPQGKELYKESLALNDLGTVHDQLVLDAEAPLGYYYLEVRDPKHDLYSGTSFMVAEYKKPEYQISVLTDRGAYRDRETINVTGEASYYFGGPVAGAAVRWSVLSQGYWFNYRCPAGQSCPWYSWADVEWEPWGGGRDYGSFGELVAQGDGQTSEKGRVSFRVPADISRKKQSQLYTVELSVTDLTGQQVSSRTEAVVHKGEFYVGIAPSENLAEAGKKAQVELLTVDWDSQPVAEVPLTVVFMEHRWYNVRRQAEDGQYYWDWTTQDTPVFTTTVTTAADGRARAAFTPDKAGTFRVRATGRDRFENEIRSSTFIWVWGGDEYVSWRQESNNRIQLIADKQEYEVGDVAEILIPSPYQGAVQALVTVERGHLMQAEVRELRSNSEVLRVPITEEGVPNVFVSVVIVQGSGQAADALATFKMGVVKLPVSIASKQLKIALTPDKEMQSGEHYGPRETATYDLLVTDNAGNPVEAELSLRLADLAVLALADEQGPTLAQAFWRGRGLGVRTSTPLVVSMEKYNREIRAAAKGGGGGEETAGLVRSRFADTAFWEPVVRTGKDGKAEVQVQLPDNLTTWRMQARGVTAETEVGQVDVDILSSLDLLVRPVLPRFFVVNDRAEIATVVHNNTGQPLDAKVNIAAEGLTVDGSTQKTVSIPAGESAKVTWPVKVLPGGEAKIRMWANAGDLYDGREDLLPVYPYSTPEVVATSGQLREAGLRQELVQLPRTFDPTQGGLTVQVDGSLTATAQDALDYLEHYPYECVEQTVSRFLPNVVTWKVLDEMGLERPELRQKLSQMVGVGLQRLYNQQHYDGGWGWWVSDKSDPFLTAYVLQGMVEAHGAGFTVDERVMAQGASFLFDNLASVGKLRVQWEANRLAYQLYVLAEYNETIDSTEGGLLGLANSLYDKRNLLSRYGQAYLAVTLDLLASREPRPAQTLLSNLAGDAVLSATGSHWEEADVDYWNMNSDVRTTAIVLWAMSRLDPESELLPNVVRWLMAVRKEGYWETTQGTVWSLLGLMEYMRASGELEGNFSWEAVLNGQEWASGSFDRETIDQGQTLYAEIGRLLVDEGNRLSIERLSPQAGQTGKGTLYYSASLKYYLPAEHVKAVDRGILVARQYNPVGQPTDYLDGAQVGDVIQVKLTLIAPTDLYYVVVEDPLPAGCEGVDLSLKTTSVIGEAPQLQNLSVREQDRYYDWYGYGWWWFSSTELRDEKVVLFAQYLPRGTYEYTYLMRAGVPGEFGVSPAVAYQMYFPEVFGRSDGGRFTIQ